MEDWVSSLFLKFFWHAVFLWGHQVSQEHALGNNILNLNPADSQDTANSCFLLTPAQMMKPT